MIDGVLLVSTIAAIATAVSVITGTCFYGCRRSRCTNIQCFCMKCERNVMTKEELLADPLPSFSKNVV